MSFDEKPLPDFHPPRKLRAAIERRRALLALADDAVPPEIALLDRIMGVAITHLVAAAARLRIADHLAVAPRTAPELAGLTGAEPHAIERTLRALAAFGVFQVDPSGRFAENRVSFALRSDHPSRSREQAMMWALHVCGEAWRDFERMPRSTESAFERATGTPIWDWLDLHEGDREIVAEAFSGRTAFEASGIVLSYPFGEVRRVCDVAGGRGLLLSEVLARKSWLTGVFQERASMLESARALFAARGVTDRVELVAGDYFAAVPGGCDAYLLKNVLHSHDDERVHRVLEVCRAAMGRKSRLVVIEPFLEKGSPYDLLADAARMVFDGGRERTQAEWRALLEAAGFRIGRVSDLVTTGMIEAILR
jgi:hypothetical protein